MCSMARYSLTLRELVKNCGLEIQAAIYRLETGRVEFLGPSPNQAELLPLSYQNTSFLAWKWHENRRKGPRNSWNIA